MAIERNGALFSYDYEEFILELKEELEDGALTLDDTICILRSDEPIQGTDYFPIIDWYYNEETMENMKENLLEENPSTWKAYEEDKPKLTSILVSELYIEMKEIDRVI